MRTTEQLRAIVAAGMAGIVVTRDDQLCSGGREPIARGAYAAEDADGWVYCLDHVVAIAAETHPAECDRPFPMHDHPSVCGNCGYLLTVRS